MARGRDGSVWRLLLPLVLSLVDLSAAFFFNREIATVTPVNPTVELGKELVLNLTLLVDHITSDELTWTSPGGFVPVNDAFQSRPNDRTLLYRKIVTDIDAEEGSYVCIRRGNGGYLERTVGATFVRVEYKAVRDVVRYRCSWNEAQNRVTCRWIVGEYNHLSPLAYDVKIMRGDDASTAVRCRMRCSNFCRNTKLEECSWTAEELQPLRHSEDDLFVELSITNRDFNPRVSKTWRRHVSGWRVEEEESARRM